MYPLTALSKMRSTRSIQSNHWQADEKKYRKLSGYERTINNQNYLINKTEPSYKILKAFKKRWETCVKTVMVTAGIAQFISQRFSVDFCKRLV